jgi:hypothetical protein
VTLAISVGSHPNLFKTAFVNDLASSGSSANPVFREENSSLCLMRGLFRLLSAPRYIASVLSKALKPYKVIWSDGMEDPVSRLDVVVLIFHHMHRLCMDFEFLDEREQLILSGIGRCPFPSSTCV